jgi:glyoxylase-like metal-dependent hydrolase (beta-lactamase superfamily II)
MNLPESKHFELKSLAPGIFAALGAPAGAAFSNAGIIDLGGQTLVFDTFMTPTAAQDLRAAAEQLTGQPVSCVINSHMHSDHWCGNQVFDLRTPILATHKTREMMPASVADLKETKANPSKLVEDISKDQQRLASVTDARLRMGLEIAVARQSYVLASLPTLEFRLPDQTFDGEIVFHGSRRTAVLHALGKGHTASDAALALPEDGILFMGDLGFFKTQPYMAGCDPHAWAALLNSLEAMRLPVFVPGHGPVGDQSDVTLLKGYITALQELVLQAVGECKTLEETLQLQLPEPFAACQAKDVQRFDGNVRALYQRLTEK